MDGIKIASVIAVAAGLLFVALGEPTLALMVASISFGAIWLTSQIVRFVLNRQSGRREPFFYRFTRRHSGNSYYYYGN